MTTAELLSTLRELGVELAAEGERLRVNAPRDALTPDLKAALVAHKATLIEMLSAAPALPPAPPLVPLPRDGELPLSFAQQRLWFLAQLEPASPLYNMPGVLHAAGTLDAGALRLALQQIVDRHEALRSTFLAAEGRPVLRIAPHMEVELPLVDLSGLPAPERDPAARRIARADAARPFDLARGPLWRFHLLRLAAAEHWILFNIHHIVGDDWSAGVILSELATLYAGFAGGRPTGLPPLAVQYADFAAWQRRWLTGPTLERQLAYWRRQLGGAAAVLDLPTDLPRPPVLGYRGDTRERVLPASLVDAVNALAHRDGATPFMALLAGFYALLARYSGQRDIAVGSPVANRNRAAIEGLIGLFVNTLVLRVDLDGDPSFRELLGRVRGACLGAFDHQDVPFEKLVEELHPSRDLAHAPLFQVMFAHDTAGGKALEVAGLKLLTAATHGGTAKFDLTLTIDESPQRLKAVLEFATDLFEAATAERMLSHYERLLGSATDRPDLPLSRLPLLTGAERHQLLGDWTATATPFPGEALIQDLVSAQAERTPEAVAVCCGGRSLPYAEVERRSNQLAWHLRAAGIRREDLVGVCLERSELLPVVLLGILKSGAAYLPLDPHFPPARLAMMVEDSRTPLVLTQDGLLDLVPAGVPVLRLDRDAAAIAARPQAPPSRVASPADRAYVLFTSGSTGRPKGVEIQHRGVVNFLTAMLAAPGLGTDDTLLAVTTLSFDISVLEMFLPLVAGARVAVATQEVATSGRLLLDEIAATGATVMQATPATWQLILHALPAGEGGGRLPRKLLCGGEALPRELAERLLARCESLWNLYGPTETTVWSAAERVTPPQRSLVPIGRPIANSTIYLLDRHLEPVPVGIPGDLYIGGAGLARGYINRPLLTAERFLPDPFAGPGERVYMTGDLARWLPDGRIEFLGRSDFQVKVRGFRIELGEIESALARHDDVAQAVVIAREDRPGDQRVVGYVRPRDGATPAPADLRRFAGERLPDYMVPSAVVVLPEFPLLPNGKVHRKALPPPPSERAADGRTFEAPSSPVENAIAEVWREALKTARVGVYDNFFDLGGHSLLAMEVVAKLEKRIGVLIHPMDMFTQTLGQLAATCEARAAGPAEGTTAAGESTRRPGLLAAVRDRLRG